MIGRARTWLVTAGMCLLSALAAPTALGASFQTEVHGTAHIQGTQVIENVFTVNNRTVRCKALTWDGKAAGPSIGELTLTPSQSECTAFGLEATVSTNGCSYGFNVIGSSEPFAGSWKVKCPPGQKIVINAPGGCTAEIGEQVVSGGVDLSNEGSGESRDVLLAAKGEGMTATVTGSLLICGTNGVRTNGRYAGTMTLKSYADPSQTLQTGFFVGEPAPLIELTSMLAGTTFLQAVQETDNVLTVNNRSFRCTSVTWSGVSVGESAITIGLTPSYSGCTFFGSGVNVTTNGCEFLLAATGGSPPSHQGKWVISCPEGKAIVLSVGQACTIEIGKQLVPGGIGLLNEVSGSNANVLITTTGLGIVTTVSGAPSVCGENGVRGNGTYTGTLALSGFADPGLTTQVGIRYE